MSVIAGAGSPKELKYCFVTPVAVSVTVIVNSTLVKAPANTQKLLLKSQPSRTLTRNSQLSGSD